MKLLYAIRCQKHSNAGRVTLVHNPSDDVTPSADKHVTSRAVHAAMQTLPAVQAKMFVTKLVKEEFVEQLERGEKTLEDLAVSVSADVAIRRRVTSLAWSDIICLILDVFFLYFLCGSRCTCTSTCT